MHFDERPTRFVAEGHDVYSDLNIFADGGHSAPRGRLRHIDYETMVMTFRGDSVNLAAGHAAVGIGST